MKAEIKKIVKWIHGYVVDADAKGVVIGLSGGVDSAVVAALAVKALGKDKVHGMVLPCTSKKEDGIDAHRVVKQLGITLEVVDLQYALFQLVTSIYGTESLTKLHFDGTLGDEATDLAIANMRARLRMVALYARSNKNNWLVIGTTNKSEAMIGYFTKYGDGGVDFEPIGEYYKTEVIKMAEELGLPEDICHRVPSPGLQEGVTDESEIGIPYSELDKMLGLINGYFQGILSYGEMMAEGGLEVRRILTKVERADHKKKMPPTCPRG
jgi:NAD+ synthase